jgi:hypothetical protein
MMSAPTKTNAPLGTATPETARAPATAQRRSGRISKEIPIVLSGSDTGGRQFSETTKTLVLSRHGASVLSHYKLIPEQEIFLLAVGTKREVEVRVCGEIGEGEYGYIYGVAFVDPSVNYWEIEFPPAGGLEKDLSRVTLECTGCRQRAVVEFDATEMDVYLVNQGALRYCKRCLNSTAWKITTEPAAPEAPVRPKQEAAAAAGTGVDGNEDGDPACRRTCGRTSGCGYASAKPAQGAPHEGEIQRVHPLCGRSR